VDDLPAALVQDRLRRSFAALSRPRFSGVMLFSSRNSWLYAEVIAGARTRVPASPELLDLPMTK
jgi:hypothetical protein